VLAAAVVHRGEEPPLCGNGGTGNLFFGRCSLRCRFCQNHEISQGERGQEVTHDLLVRAMLRLQRRGVDTLGLVTPTHYTPAIARALEDARRRGLTVPVVHNGSGVDSPAALATLDGSIDVYLPDLKWGRAAEAAQYSGAPWYPEVARRAIQEMARQVGTLRLRGDGLARSGLIVRHLVLPDDAAGSLELLAWLADELGSCALSLLRQYRPMFRISGDPRIDRPITDDEYHEVVEAARWMDFDPIFVQEPGCGELGVPDWDRDGIFDWDRGE
jgi:putative pyruvate formate lyase activating enzyme